MIWEEGDWIMERCFSLEEMEGREYVFDVIRRDPGPFLDMRTVRYQSQWKVRYRTEGTCDFRSYLEMNRIHGQVDISAYLKLMYGLLESVEAAEDRMIMSSSFELSGNTIRYHTKYDSVKFMYVPALIREEAGKRILWSSASSPAILQVLLNDMTAVDPGFQGRWPSLGQIYETWEKRGAGRHFCMKEIRTWLKEFPK